MVSMLCQQIADCGCATVAKGVGEQCLRIIDPHLSGRQAGFRNLLSIPAVRELASSEPIRQLVEPVLGPGSFAVRGILFNKLPGANWKVAWHQDCVIAVRERKYVAGWGPWSVKGGVPHVRPPAEVLARMVAVRIHLDDCDEQNGPLRVLPGSHLCGLLSDDQIVGWSKEVAVTCTAQRGDAILMRPLLLHASSAAKAPAKRRVIHIEYAADDLPHGLEWHERVA